MLGRRIAARPRPPATVRDLEIALLEEWNSIPQSLIDNLIASMANRELYFPRISKGTYFRGRLLGISEADVYNRASIGWSSTRWKSWAVGNDPL
ncbi:hypothetical protein TNCV_605001 [Trichonephila clavipes]|nr:hypothetical protein TNCV_605001 [Trichonephila clavipes]